MCIRDRTQAIASSASKLLEDLNSKPIVITSTGRAAMQLSRFRPEKDIIVFGHDELVLRQLALTWGVNPVSVVPEEPNVGKLVAMLIKESLATGLISEHDVVTMVHGFMTGVAGTTNTVQVLDVKEYLTREDRT